MKTILTFILTLIAGSLVAQDSLRQRSLSAITITAAKPLVERKQDRVVVNIDKMITAAGSNVLEILGRLPGVAVDQSGNIRLNNKNNVLVLIDNRPTYLSAGDLATLLQNMSGSEIESVEIMTNPPARYDAAGNGILNIKTKKGLKRGMNGSLTAGYSQGTVPRENIALNLNYRNAQWNLFGGLSFNDWRNASEQISNRSFAGVDGTPNQVNGHDHIRQNFRDGGIKLGADRSLGKKSTLGVLVNTNLLNGHANSVTGTEVLAGQSLTNQLQSATRFSMDRQIASANLNYRQLFNKPGQELTADADYVYYHSASRQDIHTRFFDAAGNENSSALQLQSTAPVHIDIWSGKLDYVQPLKEDMRLEAGIKSSYVSNNNELVYQRLDNGKWAPDARSNEFAYRENINAAYLNYAATLGKFSLQAGVRAENTHGKGEQRTGNVNFTRDTLNFFPTVFLQYQLSDKHVFGANYGKRIERPQYEQLNPFIILLDTLTAEQGNPALRPQYVNNIGLNYTYDKALQLTLEYSATNDVISKIARQLPEQKITIFMQENISRVRYLTASVAYNRAITSWWQAGYHVAMIYTHYQGAVDNTPVSLYNTAFNANINNSFQWRQGWSAEIGAIYNGRYLNNFLGIAQPVFSLNAGIAKSLWDNKAKLQLNLSDLTRPAERMTTDYGNLVMYNWYRGDKRRIGISFTWKFGKSSVEKERARTTGTQAEQSRLKN
ncbi:TonB-dependent receptor [Chitinophaga agrisoli]|uniref:TonB-dependent receptor n=1 Tax=Chitinophaga agrisoli TaxID=2607653 RepID=A0A5B2W4T5_9BACT|nr:outer membrane beta-barrel family protein [Chitinophaga agrisoli]KAA2245720.1 TonB-dependent receptor [Chitinophaga agrisoli]